MMVDQQWQQQLLRSIQAYAGEQEPDAYVYCDRAHSDGKYLHVPVYLPIEDAWENAEKLQTLEDAWNEEHINDDVHLIISPSGVAPQVEK